jgi:hypothetical protein
MKNRLLILQCCLFLFFITAVNTLVAQDSVKLKVKIPFAFLEVSNVQVTGSRATGKLELTMDFENKHEKLAEVSLSLGGFERMGITSDKGKKYKIYTSENLIGTKDINKGFLQVSAVQFGDKKFDWVTIVQQTISTGEKRRLTVRIDKYDKTSKIIAEFHVRCILALNYVHTGDELYRVENIPIEWK